MFYTKYKNLAFAGIVIIMLLFTSCTLSYDDGDIPMYSREDVLTMASAANFGYGRSDDVYTALEYIYNNDTIRKEHGERFEITAENIVCHTSEGKSFLFSGVYEGNAEYTFYIDNSPYRITLSKYRGEKWTIEEFYSVAQSKFNTGAGSAC